MIQMLHPVAIAVPARRDVKVALHLIAFQTTENPASVRLFAPAHSGSFGELASWVATDFTNDMVDMGIFFLGAESIGFLVVQGLVLVGAVIPLVHPQFPRGIFALEEVAGEDAVTRGVLNVDTECVAWHVDHNIQIQLQFVRDTLLHAELVVFRAAPPCFQLVEAQQGTDCQDKHRPLSAACGGCCIRRLGLGWKRREKEKEYSVSQTECN